MGTAEELVEGSRWRKHVFMLIVAAGLITMSFVCGLYMNKGTANTTAEDYNRGYLQATQDIVTLAYGQGVVRIPFNETHNYALVPWTGVDG